MLSKLQKRQREVWHHLISETTCQVTYLWPFHRWCCRTGKPRTASNTTQHLVLSLNAPTKSEVDQMDSCCNGQRILTRTNTQTPPFIREVEGHSCLFVKTDRNVHILQQLLQISVEAGRVACLLSCGNQIKSWEAHRSQVELSAFTRGGGKYCNLIALGPKSGAGIERWTKTEVG